MVIKHLHCTTVFSSKTRKAFREGMALENSALLHDVEAPWESSTFSDPFFSYRNERNTDTARGRQNVAGRHQIQARKRKGKSICNASHLSVASHFSAKWREHYIKIQRPRAAQHPLSAHWLCSSAAFITTTLPAFNARSKFFPAKEKDVVLKQPKLGNL